jgi:transposase InsO family protein
MPFCEVSIVDQREEFVRLASQPAANVRLLSRRYGISPTTGYKWLGRYARLGREGLSDRSRRPRQSPLRSAPEMEQKVVWVRQRHPAWGARKIRYRLLALGIEGVPASSTVHAILVRHGWIDPKESAKHRAFQRFEHEAPNRLWQMDFKGDFATAQGRCYPLTVLDDHSRFAVGLQACANQQTSTVKERLSAIFRRYGLPDRMTMDNGSPWGSDAEHRYTPLTAWLIRLEVGVSHSRPYHPQTQGKDERFHRTLGLELLNNRSFRDLGQLQRSFDDWRHLYNLERPHEALGMAVPASRYQPSPRAFPETLPPILYNSQDIVRKVQQGGEIWFRGRPFKIGNAFYGYPVALHPSPLDGVFLVFFCRQQVASINLHLPEAA